VPCPRARTRSRIARQRRCQPKPRPLLGLEAGSEEPNLAEATRTFLDINAIVDYNEIKQIGVMSMSSITIRNLDPAIKERLRIRAAERGHSMEAEARRILQTTLTPSVKPPGPSLFDRIHARFAPLGGVELELQPREPTREPPRFD
jgi:plasmid stability protein